MLTGASDPAKMHNRPDRPYFFQPLKIFLRIAQFAQIFLSRIVRFASSPRPVGPGSHLPKYQSAQKFRA
uniref:Uncharacterized protein n=1 Tax=mine drainage metagenome TaxID=410659 RepID=E6QJD7_9ZZZZ